ncbi:MAG: nucleotidyl transferase AbiEii/AbiGii toxin family protein, partial [Myxococcales bacterium]|nr:nucleotidyl transferase AbiEii/AbiGii toxin family protein [Myxococcales bacterium]
MRLHLDPAVKKALRACADELDALDADWAVAGATAMQVHGYARATRDIDLFIGDDVRPELLARLRARAIPVKAIFSPHHYRIDPPDRKDPEASIDLLFPALGVESLGLLAAQRGSIEGTEMPIVPLHHLVALKLTTDPGIDPSRFARDQADLVALHDRGLVDAAR